MISITSAQNPSVRLWRALKTRAGREESGLALLEGHHLTGEVLTANEASPAPRVSLRALLVDAARTREFDEYIQRAEALGAETAALPERVLNAILDARAPQGVAIIAKQPENPALAHLGRRVIALEDVQDPGNVGTVLRTADAVGFTGVLLSPACADALSPKASRAAMGAFLRVPARRSEDFYADLAAMRHVKLAGALGKKDFMRGAPEGGDTLILIGNEGAGLSPRALALADRHLSLPMPGGAESLNAAVAASVMMYACLYKAGGAWDDASA